MAKPVLVARANKSGVRFFDNDGNRYGFRSASSLVVCRPRRKLLRPADREEALDHYLVPFAGTMVHSLRKSEERLKTLKEEKKSDVSKRQEIYDKFMSLFNNKIPEEWNTDSLVQG